MCPITDLLMHSNTEKFPACQDNSNSKITFSYVSLDVLSSFQNLPSLSCSGILQQCFKMIKEREFSFDGQIALLQRFESKGSVPLPS